MDKRMHRCRCVLTVDGVPDECIAMIPLDQPFCEDCEAEHIGKGGYTARDLPGARL